jgi:guanylate cyclase
MTSPRRAPAPANPAQRVLDVLGRIGADPSDSEEVRLQKTLMVSGLLLGGAPAIAVWGALYWGLGEPLAGQLMLGTALLTVALVGLFGLTRQFALYRFLLLLLLLIAPFVITVALGGVINSSAFFLYGQLAPLQALMWHSTPRPAFGWLVAYLALLGLVAMVPAAGLAGSPLPPGTVSGFLLLNLSLFTAAFFTLLFYFVRQRSLFQARSEALLLNVLPAEIAAILKHEQRIIADNYAEASILFADVVGFTPLSAEMAPVALVEMLDEVFSHFDALVEQAGLEKIKTIGDCYMVAAGVPRRRADHALVLTQLALDMQAFLAGWSFQGRRLAFRMGINSGPVVAGVIGRKKFIYDLWGDAVNTASRMESHGSSGIIQVAPATHALIAGAFECVTRGVVNVKGKGDMEVWQVLGRKPTG